MTSKEALIKLEEMSTVIFDNTERYCVFADEIKTIRKDLEILETLKKYYNNTNRKWQLLNDFEQKPQGEILEEWLDEK